MGLDTLFTTDRNDVRPQKRVPDTIVLTIKAPPYTGFEPDLRLPAWERNRRDDERTKVAATQPAVEIPDILG